MPFITAEATSADIPAIASIFLMDGEGPNSFMQLCLGSVNRNAINHRQSERIAEGMEDKSLTWLVARDQESKKTASFAQWQIPKEEGEDKAGVNDVVSFTSSLSVYKTQVLTQRYRSQKGKRTRTR